MSDLRTAAQSVLNEYDNDSVGFKLFAALEALRAALVKEIIEPKINTDKKLTWVQENLPALYVARTIIKATSAVHVQSDKQTYGQKS